MFSYANIPLSEPEGSEVGAWIAGNIRPHELFPLASRSWPGSLGNGPILNNTPTDSDYVVINSLFWPWGASRFARGHFVITSPQLDLIRRVVYKAGALVAAPFVFSDGTRSLTTALWMLPPLPLQKAAPGLGFYLLTLVDDRYWWWGQSLDLEIDEGTTEWTDLYDDIGTNLGLTIAVDPVAAAYGTPVADYTAEARPLSPILDAIAFSVQQRVVRRFNGDVKAVNYATSKATITANMVGSPKAFAGGAFDFVARSPNDLPSLVPGTLNLAFPAQGTAAPSSNFLNIETTLASLALTGFQSIVGAPWSQLLHRYEQATYGTSGPATNLTALTTLATRFSTDWYNWQLATLDQYFVGVVPWVTEGFHDIEWRQQNGKITTRVMRGKFNPSEDLLYGSGGGFDDVVSPGGDTHELWCSNTVTSDSNTLRAEDGIPNVYRMDSGLYLCVFSVDFGNPYCFQWSGSTGVTAVFLYEVTRTSNSVLVQTSNLDDVDVWGIDVRGKICAETGSGSGTASGSDVPPADWWCVQVENCTDGTCASCSYPVGIECAEGYFGSVGNHRCIPLGGGLYRKETALSGPYASQSACSNACGGIDTLCCANVSQSLCAILSDNFAMECIEGGTVDLTYQGLVNANTTLLPCQVGMVPLWMGSGSTGDCGHSVTIKVYCAPADAGCSSSVWMFEASYPDGCTGDLGAQEGVLISCSPFHVRFSRTTGPDSCGGTELSNGYYLDVIAGPCPGSDCQPTVTQNTANWCDDSATLTVNGTCFNAVTPGNNLVKFNNGVTGTVTASTSTSLTVTIVTPPNSFGALMCSVINSNGWSGDPVEVANVIDCGGGGSSITIIGVGSNSSLGTNVTTLTMLTTVTDGLLVVNVAVFGGAAWAATFDGVPMSTALNEGGSGGARGSVRVQQFYLAVSAGTHDVVITGPSAAVQIQAINVTGLVSNATDFLPTDAFGTASAPDTGTTVSSVTNDIAVLAAFAMDTPGGTWTWAGTPTMLSGGQDVNDSVGGDISLTEGRYIATATGTFKANLTGVTPAAWAGGIAGYK